MLLLASISSFADANMIKQSHYNKRLCKIFKNKVIRYQKDMRDDSYAQATLNSYEKRAKQFCTK
jgi:hypothetical protein